MELFSVEFYVLMFTLAAMLVGLIVKPKEKSAAETSFATAMVLDREADMVPRIEFRCLENGDVALIRSGLSGLTDTATVALAITRIGFDISIEERVTPGIGGSPIERATFILGNLGAERYHVTYNSSSFSLFLATGLVNRPGVNFTRCFTQA